MKVSIDIRKSVEENAADYFEKAKKDKKKIAGVNKIISSFSEKINSFAEKQEAPAAKIKAVKQEWYEKFRWFISSDDYLVIGGRDATTNEIVIKKHTEKDDVVFHTEMPGSPFVVIKRQSKGGDVPAKTLEEAAVFTAVFSSGWKRGLSTAQVFMVKPEQVSKESQPGEYIAKGAFMIYGEKKFYDPTMSHAIGLYNNRIIGGPLSAVKKHCKDYVEIEQGDAKLSDVAKAVQKKIGGDLDAILRVLPAGCKIKK
jgi:predicted ribosome quality control (RQC) complex YloA/Tae2 family protein